jgi:hypothetical protein
MDPCKHVLTGSSDTLLRHCKVHKKGNGQDHRTPSDYHALSSPGRLDAAAATLVDLQILTERGQGMIEPVSSTNDVSNNNSAIDPRLQNHDRQNSTVAEATMDNLSNPMLDQNMQRASQNPQNGSFSFPAQAEFWNMEGESHYPSWHIGEDFDLQAFNTSLLAPMFVDESAWRVASPEGQGGMAATRRLGPHSPSATSMEVIQGLWITKADDNSRKNDGLSSSVAPTRPISPTTMSSANEVDDRYREDLSMRLRPRWKEDPLPSTKFLVYILVPYCQSLSNVTRTSHFSCSSQNSIRYSRFSMRRLLGRATTTHFCFSQFAPLVVYSWDLMGLLHRARKYLSD